MSLAIPCILRISDTHLTLLVLPAESIPELGEAIGYSIPLKLLGEEASRTLKETVEEAEQLRKLLDLPEETTVQ